MAYLATHLGDVNVATGDIGRAAAQYAEALKLFLPMGNRVGIAHCLRAVGRCAVHGGHLAYAIRLFGSSAALFREIGVAPPPGRDPALDAQSLNGHVSSAEYARAWETGFSRSSSEAVTDALALAAELTPESVIEVSSGNALSSAARPALHDRSSNAHDFGLTPREIEVLRLLADGLSDREIAERLFLSARTVGWHVTHVLAKLDAPTRTAAAAAAIRLGLI
jgi:DNA-binding NarL/FixJ family response regulator